MEFTLVHTLLAMLFLSVLLNLIYRHNLSIVKDKLRMMIFMYHEDRGQDGHHS